MERAENGESLEEVYDWFLLIASIYHGIMHSLLVTS